MCNPFVKYLIDDIDDYDTVKDDKTWFHESLSPYEQHNIIIWHYTSADTSTTR